MTMKMLGNILATAFSMLAAQAHAQSGTHDIVVAWPATMTVLVAPIIAGTDLGLFEEEGLAVSIAEFRGTSSVIPQVMNGAVQIGHIGAEPLLALKQPGRDEMPLRLFYNATPRNIWDFIVPRDSPLQTIGDLKGKTVGVQVLTNFHMPVTRALMRRHGLEEGRDYSFLPIGYGGQALHALTRGDADTYYIGMNETANYRAIGADVRVLPMDESFRGMFGAGYVAHEDMFRDRPEVLEAFGRVITQATIVCHEAPEWCVEALWTRFPELKPREGREEDILNAATGVMEALMGTYIPQGIGPDVNYGEYSQEALEDMIAILHEGNELQTTGIDPATVYTNQLVPAFNSFDWDRLNALIESLRES